MDYFEFYQLPKSFHPDIAAVKKKFYTLSKQYHPDFHINESPAKQQEILELSTQNNKAFAVLSDPRKRTEYLLQLHGLLEEGDKYQLPPDFLMEMIEINESLMELESDPSKLEQLQREVADIQSRLDEELNQLTYRFDEQPGLAETLLLSIRDRWYRQKYLLRIHDSFNKFAVR